ncbi:MAG TPA: flippase-like domain-containing protein [Dermatophilaceae bacterium]|nr:flippase-like domain-containing protein [Dermatophilaceae bacterium]
MPKLPPVGSARIEEVAKRPWRPTRRQVVQSVVGLGLAVGLVVWGLPHFAQTTWHEVFDVLGRLGPAQGAWLFVLMVTGLYLYTFMLTGSLPGLTHGRALILNVCGSSVGNLLPGGGAAGVAATYALCRSWGFSRRDISTSVIVTGVWNVLARVLLPVIGIAALLSNASQLPKAVVRGGIAGGVVAAALLLAFIAVLVSARAATWIGRGIDGALRPLLRRRRRQPMKADELIHDLRSRVTNVVRTGWLSMTFGILGYFGVWFVLFWFCLTSVGVSVPLTQAFAAYAVGRLLTAVGITPGGLGVTESGTAAVLVAWGADGAASAAAVVLFAVYTHLMEIPLGAAGWVAWGLTPKHKPGPA